MDNIFNSLKTFSSASEASKQSKAMGLWESFIDADDHARTRECRHLSGEIFRLCDNNFDTVREYIDDEAVECIKFWLNL